MFFDKVTTMLDKAVNLNEDLAWIVSIDNGVQKEIIRLNTIEQLYNEGIDALGQSLGNYSKTSVEVFGKRAGHITLKDTSEFYNSFVVLVKKDSYTIRANTFKQGNKGTINLTDRFGEEIIGLTEENQDLINEMILINIIKYVKKQLGV
jgi:hypothetical protein